MKLDLKGTPILVTRPQPEARGLASLVSAANGFPIIQPGVTIECADDGESTLEELERLADFDSVIFTSSNAVRCALARKARRDWPRDLRVVAVGPSTRNALVGAGFPQVAMPEQGAGSEALLETLGPGSLGSTLIMAARGGRTTLAETLEAAGQKAAWCYAYSRSPATPDAQSLRLVRSHWGRVVVIATSAQILENVSRMLDKLTSRPLVVPSDRVRQAARDLGFSYVAVSVRPDDESLLEAATRFID